MLSKYLRGSVSIKDPCRNPVTPSPVLFQPTSLPPHMTLSNQTTIHPLRTCDISMCSSFYVPADPGSRSGEPQRNHDSWTGRDLRGTPSNRNEPTAELVQESSLYVPTSPNPLHAHLEALAAAAPRLLAEAPPDFRLSANSHQIAALEEQLRQQVGGVLWPCGKGGVGEKKRRTSRLQRTLRKRASSAQTAKTALARWVSFVSWALTLEGVILVGYCGIGTRYHIFGFEPSTDFAIQDAPRNSPPRMSYDCRVSRLSQHGQRISRRAGSGR